MQLATSKGLYVMMDREDRLMRICVFGAGAIGGNFAARLADAGNEVSVVVRGAHLEAIRPTA